MLIRIMLHTDNFCRFTVHQSFRTFTHREPFARERPGSVHGARDAADAQPR